jgi:hypothetical protein
VPYRILSNYKIRYGSGIPPITRLQKKQKRETKRKYPGKTGVYVARKKISSFPNRFLTNRIWIRSNPELFA